MADNLVATVHTQPTISALYASLRAAWREQIGTEPTRPQLLVLMSQWAHETDSGRACLNNNLAGLKWTPGCGTDYAQYMTWEMVHGQHVAMRQTFRAYPTLYAGVRDYLHLLRGRFGFAWPAVVAGDVADFASKLRARGYYTDTVANYTAGLQRRYVEIDEHLGPDTQPDVQLAADALRAAIADVPRDVHDSTPPPADDVA